jgi:hypothetical protein
LKCSSLKKLQKHRQDGKERKKKKTAGKAEKKERRDELRKLFSGRERKPDKGSDMKKEDEEER